MVALPAETKQEKVVSEVCGKVISAVQAIKFTMAFRKEISKKGPPGLDKAVDEVMQLGEGFYDALLRLNDLCFERP